jgi:hypothetical protein
VIWITLTVVDPISDDGRFSDDSGVDRGLESDMSMGFTGLLLPGPQIGVFFPARRLNISGFVAVHAE